MWRKVTGNQVSSAFCHQQDVVGSHRLAGDDDNYLNARKNFPPDERKLFVARKKSFFCPAEIFLSPEKSRCCACFSVFSVAND